MAERLKELLEKIHEEGIKLAEEKARAIEKDAHAKAAKIIEDAKKEANRIIGEARLNMERMKSVTEASLRQAARDTVLSIKKELRNILDKLIYLEVSKVIGRDEMVNIITDMINSYMAKGGSISDIVVLVKREDLEKLTQTFMGKLKEKIKEGIELKPSPHIKAGFAISFDKGESFYDFSDEGITQALRVFLGEELSRLLT